MTDSEAPTGMSKPKDKEMGDYEIIIQNSFAHLYNSLEIEMSDERFEKLFDDCYKGIMGIISDRERTDPEPNVPPPKEDRNCPRCHLIPIIFEDGEQTCNHCGADMEDTLPTHDIDMPSICIDCGQFMPPEDHCCKPIGEEQDIKKAIKEDTLPKAPEVQGEEISCNIGGCMPALFVLHIQEHLSDDKEVVCKICDKTILEIYSDDGSEREPGPSKEKESK